MESMMKGAFLATMAGGFFGCASSGTADKMANDTGHDDMAAGVMCAGINGCGGKGACASADNACKGHNGCKGKGWITTASAADCTAQGGTVVAGKM